MVGGDVEAASNQHAVEKKAKEVDAGADDKGTDFDELAKALVLSVGGFDQLVLGCCLRIRFYPLEIFLYSGK